MGQELVHVVRPHITGMTLAMKQDKALDPTQVGSFGAYAVVPGTQGNADLFQKFGGLALTLHHHALLGET
jgi:hypothetical protein